MLSAKVMLIKYVGGCTMAQSRQALLGTYWNYDNPQTIKTVICTALRLYNLSFNSFLPEY
jgi:hypothetical protein